MRERENNKGGSRRDFTESGALSKRVESVAQAGVHHMMSDR